MKCPDLHITHVWQHHPMEQGEGDQDPIHENTFMMEIQWNVKLMFSIPPPPKGVLAKFTKKGFFLKLHEMAITTQKFTVWQPSIPWGRSLANITKMNFDENCM